MKGLNTMVYIPVTGSSNVAEMINWCYNNVDRHNLNWDWDFVDDSDLNSDANFYFRDPKIATVFSLKWT